MGVGQPWIGCKPGSQPLQLEQHAVDATLQLVQHAVDATLQLVHDEHELLLPQADAARPAAGALQNL